VTLTPGVHVAHGTLVGRDSVEPRVLPSFPSSSLGMHLSSRMRYSDGHRWEVKTHGASVDKCVLKLELANERWLGGLESAAP
jgi:hypothetical protein